MSQEDQNKQKDLGRWREKAEKENLTTITTLRCAKFKRVVWGSWKFDSCINAEIIKIFRTGNEAIVKKGLS